MDLEPEATAMAIALENGAVELDSIVSWVDAIIAKEARTDPNLIDLSLAKTNSEALSALNRLRRSHDKAAVAKYVLRFFHASLICGKADHGKIAKALYFMAMDGYLPHPSAESGMMHFWDALGLAITGTYGSKEQVQKEMLKFIEDASGDRGRR